jgi:hypothetical protein
LEPEPGRVNLNDRGELQRIESTLLQQLKEIGGPPSVGYDTRTGRDEGLHGWKEEVSAARAEEALMDSVADGPVGGKQHRGEFFANNRDQDASDMPPSAAMGIMRPKPSVTLNNTVAASANSGSAASSASAAAAAAPTPSKVLKSEDVAPMEQ